MKHLIWLAGILLCLVGCGSTGPVFLLEDKVYDWVKAPGAVDLLSDAAPIVDDPAVTFRLAPGQRHSALKTGEDWRIGQAYLFGFDVRLDPEALGAQPMTISSVSRITVPEREIVSVRLDPHRGVTVFGRSCIQPEKLSEWHRVEMRIRISNNDKGFLEVFCDRQPIWAQVNMRTTFPPVCRLLDGCDADVAKPARFAWQIGLMGDQPVSKTIEIQMQRLHQRVIFYIPNRAGTL